MRELLAERLVGRAPHAGLRDQKAGRRRDDQRRHLAREAVADGQQGIALGGVAEAQALLRHADDDAADHVDEGDEQGGHRVAAHELRGTVHGAEEGGFLLQGRAARLGGLLVDQAGGEIGVDGHLLAGHRIEGEAGRDLGDAARALRDHHEVHDDQDREHDDPDDEVAAHHEVAEGLDDVAGRRRPLVAVAEDQPRRGEVQGEPQHRGDQQQRREDGEFQRVVDRQAGHHDQHRHDDRDGQQQVEQYRRQREDQHREDRPSPPVANNRSDRLDSAWRSPRVGSVSCPRTADRSDPCRRARRLRHRSHPPPSAGLAGSAPGKICRVGWLARR